MSGALVTGFLKSFFEEYVSGLENVKESNFSEPLTLHDLTLKVAKINEEIDDVGTCPFNLTDGKIGSLSLKPGWLGGLTICASAVELNLSFSAMKAMKGAVAGNSGEDMEEDLQNQVPWDVQQGMINGHPPQPIPINKQSAVFCKDHETSEQRIKAEPMTRPCQHCKQDLTTNYKEFALCPNCSGTVHKCMICGKAAVGSGAPGGPPPPPNGLGAPPPLGGPPPPPGPPGQKPRDFGPPPRHVGTTCDGCQERDFMGVKYRCLNCKDYDLCEKCYTRRGAIHPQNHQFETIQPKGAPGAPPPYSQSSPRDQPSWQKNSQQPPPWGGGSPQRQPSQENRPPWQQSSPPQQNGPPNSPWQGTPGGPAPGSRAPFSTPNTQYGGQQQGRPPPGPYPQRNNSRQAVKPGSWNWLFHSCAAVDERRDQGEIRR